jgi:CRP-like cAMP-binding protein/AmiR/NasT family two-component response regulator
MTKVLVIVNNNKLKENISEILQLANYSVFSTDNGKKGVEMALKNIPDIILCDIMMDELDGYGVLYLLNKHEETNTIPFIFITDKMQKQDLRKGMEMGADDFLIKPFDDLELLSTVESRLKKRELQKNFYSKSMNKLNQMTTNHEGLSELKRVIDNHKYRTYKKKQVVYYEGDKVTGIYFIICGKIKITKIAENGRELTTNIYNADDFIGTNVLFSHDEYTDNAIAIEETTLCFFPIHELEKLISTYPDVASKFIKILSNEIVEREEQLVQIAYSSVRKRIAETLLHYHQQNCSNGESIDLSRNELANLSGTATETVSRILTEFESEGLIDKKRNEIILLDSAKLSKLRN